MYDVPSKKAGTDTAKLFVIEWRYDRPRARWLVFQYVHETERQRIPAETFAQQRLAKLVKDSVRADSPVVYRLRVRTVTTIRSPWKDVPLVDMDCTPEWTI